MVPGSHVESLETSSEDDTPPRRHIPIILALLGTLAGADIASVVMVLLSLSDVV